MSEPRLCACGCGQQTPLAKQTRTRLGHVKGEPTQCLLGHSTRRAIPLIDRFWGRVQHKREDGCWEWTGTRSTYWNYPKFYVGGRKYVLAHRWSYEHFVGPIPDGLTIDHLCRFTLCVNPEHLEPVDAVENVMRGEGACAQHARKTHCKRGHPFTEDNIYWGTSPNGGAKRQCKTCAKELRDTQRNKGAKV